MGVWGAVSASALPRDLAMGTLRPLAVLKAYWDEIVGIEEDAYVFEPLVVELC